MRENHTMRRRDALSWIGLVVAGAAIVVVAWAFISGTGAIIHGHPTYLIVLIVTALGAFGFGAIALRRPIRRGAWRLTGRIVLLVLAAGWVATFAWLRPYTAVEPALAAMQSSATVTVTESPTNIVIESATAASDIGVFFQPGALVDPRAYAAVLRPLAEAGHTVVITKQPLGIAFLALGAYDTIAAGHTDVAEWILGGHSLGGTVASMQASEPEASVAGLLLFASYPANDISDLEVPVLSISGSNDGLATPAKIEASRPDLPPRTAYLVIDGGSHAQFGDYGIQAGDGEPSITHDKARTHISDASVAFADSLG